MIFKKSNIFFEIQRLYKSYSFILKLKFFSFKLPGKTVEINFCEIYLWNQKNKIPIFIA